VLLLYKVEKCLRLRQATDDNIAHECCKLCT